MKLVDVKTAGLKKRTNQKSHWQSKSTRTPEQVKADVRFLLFIPETRKLRWVNHRENKKDIDKTKLDSYNKFTSESGHWYAQDGEPMYTIIGANGKERNTTLRDAKSLGLVPSVTTILGMIAKPSLENWKINQALNSALTLEKNEGESLESCLQM